jgi:hypothetical protein
MMIYELEDQLGSRMLLWQREIEHQYRCPFCQDEFQEQLSCMRNGLQRLRRQGRRLGSTKG